MQRILIYIFPLIITISAKAQVERRTYHDNALKQVKEVYYVTDTLSNVLQGPYISYFLNGEIESKGVFDHNETTGRWEFYYETGKLKMRGELGSNNNDGYWDYFYENGKKSMEGEINNRKRRGHWKIYYESGILKEEGVFRNDIREDTWVHYYEDGKLKAEIDYIGNKGRYTQYYPTGEKEADGYKSGNTNTGSWKYYHKDGSLQAEGEYLNGKKTGLWKYYYVNGLVAAEGAFKSGEPEGQWVYNHENGQISSKGVFIEGQKNGYWGLYYDDGTLKGKAVFDKGSGVYTEYYKNGNIKAQGAIIAGKNTGKWDYYYEGGAREGECEFIDGKGEYYGYYPNGNIQSKGTMEDGKKVGKWDLYDSDGMLSGYYNPIYDNKTIKDDELKIHSGRPYGVGAYKFKTRQFKYFDAKINEFQGIIIGFNPLAAFIGRMPLGFEFYMQERLGHEFEFEGIRDPFFKNDNDIPLNEVYTRGYAIAVKQKFYNPDHVFGLWYFGHEIRFTNKAHYANHVDEGFPDLVVRANASEQKIEYSVMLGYRVMQNISGSGFTIDTFLSLGSGYRNFKSDEAFRDVFDELQQAKVPITFNFGLNFGYVLSFDARR